MLGCSLDIDGITVQDTMREKCLGELASIWYNLVVTYSESNPDLAEAVLSVVKRYVSWIDIGLVANDRCQTPLDWHNLAIHAVHVRMCRNNDADRQPKWVMRGNGVQVCACAGGTAEWCFERTGRSGCGRAVRDCAETHGARSQAQVQRLKSQSARL